MKPEKPLVYNEFYLDAMTGGETSPPTPVTREQHYLAKLAGLTVDVPQPVTLREKFLAKACEMDVDVPTYTAGLPRIYSWLAKAAGQDVETPTPITREELYWDEYTSVHEYELSGIPPLTFPSNGQPLLDYLISGNTVQNGTPTPDNPVMPQGTGDLETSGTKAGQYKIPISSANTTTPVYLGDVETMRRIKKMVLTGQETFNKADSTTETGTTVFSIRYDAIGMEDIIDYDEMMVDISYPVFICSHFKMKTNTSFGTPYTAIKNGEIGANSVTNDPVTYNRYVIFASNQYTTAADFKSYLAQQYAAGTPVTLYYVLATAETGIVNEPLHKIGDYADTVSKAQAGVEIPTTKGSTTLDVETTVKPSEVYIKYKE